MLGPNQQAPYAATNIHQVLERVRQLIETESQGHIEVDRDYDPSIPELEANAEQLIQACLNIAQNAWHALQQGTNEQPALTLRTRALRQFTIGNIRHRNVCRIDIIDNGPGIPEALQQTIFYPMVSGSGNGSGLGLTIAQYLVDRHQGLIEFSSEPGHTCFTLYLPFSQIDLED